MSSPIVATILLLMIIMVTSVTVLQLLTVSPPPSEMPFLVEKVRIEAVSIEENVVRVYVRNLMNNDVRIEACYVVNGTSGLTLAYNLTTLQVKGDSVVEVAVTLLMVLPKGVYIAKVVTAKGYVSSYIFTIS